MVAGFEDLGGTRFEERRREEPLGPILSLEPTHFIYWGPW